MGDADRRARFESVYERHYGAVWAYLRRRLRSAVDTDDVAAQTWLAVWRRLDALPVENELAWCYGTARRCLANHRRGEERRLRLVRRVEFERTDDAVRSLDPRAQGVHDALARLPTDDAELLRLSAWEQLSVADIALVLDLAPSTVSVRLHRARKRLASRLGPEASGFRPGLQDPEPAGHMSSAAPDDQGH